MSKKAVTTQRPLLARVSEAAQALNVSRGLLYKAIERADGSVPVKRICGTIRIPWAWVDAQAELVPEEDQQRL